MKKTSFRRKDGSLNLLMEKPALTVRELMAGSEEYQQASSLLSANNVKYGSSGFLALDIAFTGNSGHLYEPEKGHIINVRLECDSLPEGIDPSSIAVQRK